MNRLLSQYLYGIISFIRDTFCSIDILKSNKNSKNFIFVLLKILLRNSFKAIFNYFFNKFVYYYNMRHLSKGNYISSIKKFYSNELNEIDYKILTPRMFLDFKKEERNFLNIVNGGNAYIHPKGFSYTQREVFSCFLKNVKFVGSSGVLIKNNIPLIESGFSLFRIRTALMFDYLIPKRKKMKGIFTSIMHWDYLYNHYHFLIDNLPRLYSITKIEAQEIYFIIPKNYKKFYLDIIKIFLDERFRIIYIEPDEVWDLEKFHFASFCSNDRRFFGYIPKKYLDFVKNKIFEEFGIKKANQEKRIYISREKATKRRILNENQFLELLTKYNFEAVYTEDLTFKEEVELFNSVSIVVSPTGAGLANMIFSTNIKVLELLAPNYIIQSYLLLCKILEFDYRFIIGNGANDNQDFKVNLIEVEKILKEFIKN